MTSDFFTDGKKYKINLLSAFESLSLISAEAGLNSRLEEELSSFDSELSHLAVLAASALYDGDSKAFDSGYSALNGFSREQLESFGEAYRALSDSSSGTLIIEKDNKVGGEINQSDERIYSRYENVYFNKPDKYFNAEDISEILERETRRRFRNFSEE